MTRAARPSPGAAHIAALAASIALAASPAATLAQAGPGVRERVLETARRRVGRPFRGDCSTFVLETLREAGISLRLPPARSRSESIHLATRPTTAPLPGDLAFFDHTYDRNGDGRANDPFTHVALVEAVDGDSIVLLHRSRRGIERIRMDATRPSDPTANDPVRALERGEDPATRVLAGELFAGFGTPFAR